MNMTIVSSKEWGMQIKTALEPLNLSRVDAIALHHMAHPTADIYEVERWHLNQGWRAFGYNYWIAFDGTVYEGRGLNMGAGVANQNDHIISIGFQGNYQPGIGLDVNTMSDAQFNAGVDMIKYIQQQVPTATRIGGHRDFMATACPGDNFPLAEMQSLQKRNGKEQPTVPLTVQTLEQVYVQTIPPLSLGFHIFDAPKRDIGVPNYFNGGFFAQTEDGTIPVGNLADSSWVFAQSKDNPSWINVAGKKLSTLWVKEDGSCGIERTDDLSAIAGLKTAISGIPIAKDGQQVTLEEIKAEGYDGSELYYTWHGFLGLRDGGVVYVAAQCDFGQMFWILRALGIKDAIKLDGGGSFILHNDVILQATEGNRVINNAGMW